MTEITTSEIKVIVIQIVLMSILGTFMFLYSGNPVSSSQAPDTAVNQSTQVSSSGSWVFGLIFIPEGMGDLFFISLLVISPFLLFDALIGIRLAKDFATQWF